jgi:hypothetical protein
VEYRILYIFLKKDAAQEFRPQLWLLAERIVFDKTGKKNHTISQI